MKYQIIYEDKDIEKLILGLKGSQILDE